MLPLLEGLFPHVTAASLPFCAAAFVGDRLGVGSECT